MFLQIVALTALIILTIIATIFAIIGIYAHFIEQ